MNSSVWFTILSSSACKKDNTIYGLNSETVTTDLAVLQQGTHLPKQALLPNGSVSPMVITKAILSAAGVAHNVINLDSRLPELSPSMPSLPHPMVPAQKMSRKLPYEHMSGHYKQMLIHSVSMWYGIDRNSAAADQISEALIRLAAKACWTSEALRESYNYVYNLESLVRTFREESIERIYIAESVPNGTTTASILTSILNPHMDSEIATYEGTASASKLAEKVKYVNEIREHFLVVRDLVKGEWAKHPLHVHRQLEHDFYFTFMDDFQIFLFEALRNLSTQLARNPELVRSKRIILAGGGQMRSVMELLRELLGGLEYRLLKSVVEIHTTEWVNKMNKRTSTDRIQVDIRHNRFKYSGRNNRLTNLHKVIEGCGLGGALGILKELRLSDYGRELLEHAVDKPIKHQPELMKSSGAIL